MIARSIQRAERAARRRRWVTASAERMWSRLHEMCKRVEMEGPDFRQHFEAAEFRRHRQAPTRLRIAAQHQKE